MPKEPVVTTLSKLSASSLGAFRAEGATALGVTPNQLARLSRQGVIERVFPHTYRMTAISPSAAQRLRAALLWAGDRAAAAGRSAGELHGLEGVRASSPEIVLPHEVRGRMRGMTVSHGDPARADGADDPGPAGDGCGGHAVAPRASARRGSVRDRV